MSVVVPVHDNAATLEELVARVLACLEPVSDALEVLIVDDASHDGSWEVIRRLASDDARITGLRLDRNWGNLTARAVAIREACGDIVCTLDADLENAPEDLPRLVAGIVGGADLVSAVRIDQRGRPLSRRTTTYALRFLVSHAFGAPPRDFGCGMKAFTRQLCRDADRAAGPELGLRWAVALFRLARHYDEVEVAWIDAGGTSSHTAARRLRMALALTTVLWRDVLPSEVPVDGPVPQVAERC